MRLIDANRLKALLMVDFMQLELFGQKYKVSDALRTVDNTPTEDAVPVIRCKDCIRNGTPDCAMEYHYLDSDWRFNDYSWNNENDFCSYGERKKE